MGLRIVQFFSAAWQRSGVRTKGGLAAVWFAFAMLALTPAALAQDNATITGTVADSSGAEVTSAALQLTNPSTGQVRETVSNSAGAYRFANVAVGTYTLTATASGFEKFTKTGIVVNVAQTVQADVTLKVGSTQETVTVEANALQPQSQTSEVSTLISGQQVQQLSTNGRNVTALAALGPPPPAAWVSPAACPNGAGSPPCPLQTVSAPMAPPAPPPFPCWTEL